MKTGAAILFTLFAAANAFTTPMFATRAVGAKKAPVKKAATKAIKKAPVKRAPVKKAPVKKAPAKKAPVKKAPIKRAPVKKAPIKRAPVKKAPIKRAPVKKAPVKRAPVKRAPFKKAPVKKAAPAPKIAAKSFTPSSAYISIDTSGFKFPGISGGGNKAPVNKIGVPDLSDPSLQIYRDPAFYAAAAKTRLQKKPEDFVYDDGLTVIERQQRRDLPGFLSGSAKSQADETAIVGEIEGVDFFGLSADRFQLLFISVFGLFFLVGYLSGSIPA